MVVVPIWLFCLHRYKTYADYRQTRTDLLFFRIARAVGMATLGLLSALFLLQLAGDVSRTMLVGFALTSMATLFVARRGMIDVWRRLHRQGLATHDILVVGRAVEVAPLIETLERQMVQVIRLFKMVGASVFDIAFDFDNQQETEPNAREDPNAVDVPPEAAQPPLQAPPATE